MNFTKLRPVFLLSAITIISTLFIWLVFYFNLPQILGFPKTSLETVFANYDGPNYLAITKCGYDKACIAKSFSLPSPLEYYPAHLPGYPALIKILSIFTSTPKAMLLATLLGSIFLTIVSFYFFKTYLESKSAFWLSLLFIFFPARFFILRLVGAPETWFIGFILLSLLLNQRKQYLGSALAGCLALFFKSPGILLFGVYGLKFLFELFKNKKILFNYSYYLLVPLTGLFIFYIYYLQTGDFWAYFHSGDNIHLMALPYLVFVSNHTWINTIWLEEIIYIYVFCFSAIYLYYQKHKIDVVWLFLIVFTLAGVFVAHRDISRYLSPAYPLILLAFSRFVNTKPAKIIFWLILPAIILYSINFIIGNVAPVADWAPYL
ncbi:MAG TPA: hypothetical protein PK639_01660 [Candidatus Woesebacteria bacterium]|nr:hypothetical protein [Candidatus Woesebacteria bacterium]